MSYESIGWVMDQDTSSRRLHLFLADAGVGLSVEVPGQPPATMTLDVQGIEVLYAYVGQAFVRLLAGQGHWVPERRHPVPETLAQHYDVQAHRWEAEAHLVEALVALVAADRDCTLGELLQTWTRYAGAVFGALRSQVDAGTAEPVNVRALLDALDRHFRTTHGGELRA